MLREGTHGVAEGGKPSFADVRIHGADMKDVGTVENGGGNVGIGGNSCGSNINCTVVAVIGIVASWA